MKNWQKKAFERFPENWFRDIDGDSYDANERERYAYLAGIEDALKLVWHEPDEKPYPYDKRLTLEALRRPLLCAFEDHFAIYLAEDLRILAGVKKWAYVDELIPFELEQF